MVEAPCPHPTSATRAPARSLSTTPSRAGSQRKVPAVETALSVEPGSAELLGMRAELLLASGDHAASAAFAVAADAAAGPGRNLARTRQAWALLLVGDVGGAARALDGIVADDVARLPLALTSGMLAWFTGRFDDAARAAEESMALAARNGVPARLLEAAFLQALVAHSSGRWADQFRIDLSDPRLDGVLAGVVSDAHLCASEIYLFSQEPAGIAAAAARQRGVLPGGGGGWPPRPQP